MVKHQYNGITLPTIPAGDTYAVISHQPSSNTYFVMRSSMPFIITSGIVAFFGQSQGNTYKAYQAMVGGVSWVQVSVNVGDGTGALYALDQTTNIVWSSHDIMDYDTQGTGFAGSTPVEIVGAEMPGADWLYMTPAGKIKNGNVVITKGRTLGYFLMAGISPDNGMVAVSWVWDGVVKGTETDNGSILSAQFTPPADVVGTHTLYMQVGNFIANGDYTIGKSNTLTVTVVEPYAVQADSLLAGIMAAQCVHSELQKYLAAPGATPAEASNGTPEEVTAASTFAAPRAGRLNGDGMLFPLEPPTFEFSVDLELSKTLTIPE